jgi:hypothetical protein
MLILHAKVLADEPVGALERVQHVLGLLLLPVDQHLGPRVHLLPPPSPATHPRAGGLAEGEGAGASPPVDSLSLSDAIRARVGCTAKEHPAPRNQSRTEGDAGLARAPPRLAGG